MQRSRLPGRQGLYDPVLRARRLRRRLRRQHQGRRVARRSSSRACRSCANLTHRGACGCDPLTGDGAGILMQMPDAFLRKVVRARSTSTLPPPRRVRRRHGVPARATSTSGTSACELFEKVVREEGQRLLGWRTRAGRRAASAARWRASRCRRSARSSSARGRTTPDAAGARAQALRHPQARRARWSASPACATRESLLRPEPLVAHHRLQGPAAARADPGSSTAT